MLYPRAPNKGVSFTRYAPKLFSRQNPPLPLTIHDRSINLRLLCAPANGSRQALPHSNINNKSHAQLDNWLP
jgi:hypothetical protein